MGSHEGEHECKSEERLSSLETATGEGCRVRVGDGCPVHVGEGPHGIEPAAEDGEEKDAYASACC